MKVMLWCIVNKYDITISKYYPKNSREIIEEEHIKINMNKENRIFIFPDEIKEYD